MAMLNNQMVISLEYPSNSNSHIFQGSLAGLRTDATPMFARNQGQEVGHELGAIHGYTT